MPDDDFFRELGAKAGLLHTGGLPVSLLVVAGDRSHVSFVWYGGDHTFRHGTNMVADHLGSHAAVRRLPKDLEENSTAAADLADI